MKGNAFLSSPHLKYMLVEANLSYTVQRSRENTNQQKSCIKGNILDISLKKEVVIAVKSSGGCLCYTCLHLLFYFSMVGTGSHILTQQNFESWAPKWPSRPSRHITRVMREAPIV